jgi:hypothetical protein
VHPAHYPIFDPLNVPSPPALQLKEDLLATSEDWALCYRARELGFKSYAATRPVTGHIGNKTFTVIEDSQKESKSAEGELARSRKEFIDTAALLESAKLEMGPQRWEAFKEPLTFDADALLAKAGAMRGELP